MSSCFNRSISSDRTVFSTSFHPPLSKAMELDRIPFHGIKLGQDKGADQIILGLMAAIRLAIVGKAVIGIPVLPLQKTELIVPISAR